LLSPAKNVEGKMRSRRDRKVGYDLERGRLVRRVEQANGRTYTHRCSLETLQEVTWYVEEHAADGVATGELWVALPDFPATQLSVALEFLKEHGCVETSGRRNYPGSDILFEDVMCHFHALEVE
jgi:hypothetical protein